MGCTVVMRMLWWSCYDTSELFDDDDDDSGNGAPQWAAANKTWKGALAGQ